MTDYELTRLQIIQRVLTRYVAGDHHAKRYTPEQKREDLERLRVIENKINTHERHTTNKVNS